MNNKLNHDIVLRNLSKCPKQVSDDICSLLIASMGLILLAIDNKNKARFASIASHGVALLNGVLGVETAYYHSNSKIFIILWYLPAMLFFAKRGFQASKATDNYRAEINKFTAQHQELTDLLEKSSPTQINNIAKTYRTEIPQDDNPDYITPDNINHAIHYILMRYQR